MSNHFDEREFWKNAAIESHKRDMEKRLFHKEVIGGFTAFIKDDCEVYLHLGNTFKSVFSKYDQEKLSDIIGKRFGEGWNLVTGTTINWSCYSPDNPHFNGDVAVSYCEELILADIEWIVDDIKTVIDKLTSLAKAA